MQILLLTFGFIIKRELHKEMFGDVFLCAIVLRCPSKLSNKWQALKSLPKKSDLSDIYTWSLRANRTVLLFAVILMAWFACLLMGSWTVT